MTAGNNHGDLRAASLTAELKALGEAVTSFAQRESVLRRNNTAAVRKAEQAFREASGSLEPEIGQTLQEVRDRYAAARDKVAARQQREWADAKARCDRCEARVHAFAAHRIDIAKHHYQETAWMAKNGLTAVSASERAACDHQCASAEAHRSDAEKQFRQSRRYLRRFRDLLPAINEETHRAAIGEAITAAALNDQLIDDLETAQSGLSAVAATSFFGMFRYWGAVVWSILLLLPVGGILFGLQRIGRLNAPILQGAIGVSIVAIVIFFVLETVTRRRLRALVPVPAVAAARAIWLVDHIQAVAGAEKSAAVAEYNAEMDEKVRLSRSESEAAAAHAESVRERRLRRVAAAREKLLQALAEQHRRELPALAVEEEAALAAISDHSVSSLDALSIDYEVNSRAQKAAFEAQFTNLKRDWDHLTAAAHERLEAIDRCCDELCPTWDDPAWQNWRPLETVESDIPFGTLAVETETLFNEMPTDPKLELLLPESFRIPAVLTFPDRCSLLIEGRDRARELAIPTLQNIMCRLLTRAPAGTIRFTLFDPIGLGQSFAAFMHLADYDDALIGGRIWTDERQIDQCLADLNDHMETVIQKYLRNEYASIADYNAAAGQIAEPFRFLVIADFPVNFSENAVRRLMSIVDSGARCGVYVLMFWDTRHAKPGNFSPSEIRRRAVHLQFRGGNALSWRGDGADNLPLRLDSPPPPELLSSLLHRIGEASNRRARVEVPFSSVAPNDAQIWSRSSAEGLEVPLGQTGTKVQRLELGRGTAQHVLVAGNTGSGKSTLLHVLITNASLWYSPAELQFYLIDFKKGVEFKSYATLSLPHAQAIAIESDRGFGLSVLARVDELLKERGELFRQHGVQSIPGYRRLTRLPPAPRIMVIIDEFQEFFVEDDKISQEAALLLDRIIRQGRAFGIHVLLGSQTLGGAYSLARSTIGQMSVRIALQCSEQDSYLILGDDNTAARLLSRPGEAIYNDSAGAVEANSPFQVVWLDDQERDSRLRQVVAHHQQHPTEDGGPAFVFEGNMPADINRNLELAGLPTVPAAAANAPLRLWLGAPNAIKGPTAISLRRQGGHHLLIVGQQDETALALCRIAMVAIARQRNPEQVRFTVLDGSPADARQHGLLGRTLRRFPHACDIVDYAKTDRAIAEVAAEITRRRAAETTDQPQWIIILYGLQRYRVLRSEDDYSFAAEATPDRQFVEILKEGPDLGIHVITWCDTLNNLSRTLPRRLQRELDHRILLQMSGADSMNLMDSPAAASLGMVRAIYYNEQEGIQETFNPYAMPPETWFD